MSVNIELIENIDYIDIFEKKIFYKNDQAIAEIIYFQPSENIHFEELLELASCSDEMFHTLKHFNDSMRPSDLYIDWLCVEDKGTGLGSKILKDLINEKKPKRVFFIIPDINMSVKEFYVKTLDQYDLKKEVKQFLLFKRK